MNYLDLMNMMSNNRNLSEMTSVPFIVDGKICWFNYLPKKESDEVIYIFINDIFYVEDDVLKKINSKLVLEFKIVDQFIGDDDEYYDFFKNLLKDCSNLSENDIFIMWKKIDEVSPRGFINIYNVITETLKREISKN